MSLVELLVAMSITVVISALIILSWVALSGSYANTVKRGKAGDFTRLAITRMAREIRDVEQPPAPNPEVAIVRADRYTMVLYTTFNKAGNDESTTPPRLVMYRLYANGELWRFSDVDGVDGITGVEPIDESTSEVSPSASATGRTTGEGRQLMSANLVNASSPSATTPTALFTYIYYGSAGDLARSVHMSGSQNRSRIQAVELNLLIDLNPGKSPIYAHQRTTAQLRNMR